MMTEIRRSNFPEDGGNAVTEFWGWNPIELQCMAIAPSKERHDRLMRILGREPKGKKALRLVRQAFARIGRKYASVDTGKIGRGK